MLRFGIALWLVTLAVGFGVWEAYDATPGGTAAASPAEATPTGRPALVVFVHPHCPCSRATLAELADVLAAAPGGATVEVVFVRPEGTPGGWEQGESWAAAAALPGVSVRVDVNGAEARGAGAETSGQVVARDAAGRVVFRGGITRARGRGGDNPGRRAVAAVLAGQTPEVGDAPVFGCPLVAPAVGGCSDPEGRGCRR